MKGKNKMKKIHQLTLCALGVAALVGCVGRTTPCCDKVREDYKPTVHFAFDSAMLTNQGKHVLDEVPQKIKDCPELIIDITGYTDNVGTPAYNKELGKERAQSVQNYLTSLGISGHHIRTMSMGEADPAACNSTEEGRMQNRRAVVEFK